MSPSAVCPPATSDEPDRDQEAKSSKRDSPDRARTPPPTREVPVIPAPSGQYADAHTVRRRCAVAQRDTSRDQSGAAYSSDLERHACRESYGAAQSLGRCANAIRGRAQAIQ